MALSSDDIESIAALVELKLEPRFERIDTRFDQLSAQIEGLYQRDETREQEYLAMREQMRRLEKRVEALEQTAA